MDMIFTQEELFWLDDILPGTKLGPVRRLSAARHVHIPKSTDDDNDEPITVNQFYFISLAFFFLNKTNIIFQPPIDPCRNNLRSIEEVGFYISI